ncbi:hypothetical protein Asi03nite_18330 [Actinoplanes siamensis]|uniref:Uncharacterized protein n=1 Tax=Actinoplanes siamensis TaxID=1223317 RepID=A0A919N4J6_9ACTN|nr:hypothetical protein Asi03nite_18330 [Actinoplanes siamensis]
MGTAALTTDLALTHPAAAAGTGTPAVTTAPDGPDRLKAALLTLRDLPKGYVAVPGDMMSFSGAGTGGGNCAKVAGDRPPAGDRPEVPDRPVAPGSPAGPGLPVRPSPRTAAVPPVLAAMMTLAPGAAESAPPNPATSAPGGATTTTDARADLPVGPSARPGLSPRPSDSPRTGSPAPGGNDGGKDPTVQAAFMKGETGPVLLEAINPAGDRAARKIVAAVADSPRRCPTYDEGRPGTADYLHMAMFPLRVPKLGEESAGVRFEVELNHPPITVRGKAVAVAVRGVAVTVLLAHVEEPSQHELETIARTAVQKINRKR